MIRTDPRYSNKFIVCNTAIFLGLSPIMVFQTTTMIKHLFYSDNSSRQVVMRELVRIEPGIIYRPTAA